MVSVSQACTRSGYYFRISTTFLACSFERTIVVPGISKSFKALFMPVSLTRCAYPISESEKVSSDYFTSLSSDTVSSLIYWLVSLRVVSWLVMMLFDSSDEGEGVVGVLGC